MQLFNYIKDIAKGGTYFRSVKPKVTLKIDTSKEKNMQKTRSKNFKSVKSYSEDDKNLLNTSQVTFEAQIHGINMKNIVDKIFNF